MNTDENIQTAATQIASARQLLMRRLDHLMGSPKLVYYFADESTSDEWCANITPARRLDTCFGKIRVHRVFKEYKACRFIGLVFSGEHETEVHRLDRVSCSREMKVDDLMKLTRSLERYCYSSPVFSWKDAGTTVLDYAGNPVGETTGRTSRCKLEGCTGVQVHIVTPHRSRVVKRCEKEFTVEKQGRKFVIRGNHPHFNLGHA